MLGDKAKPVKARGVIGRPLSEHRPAPCPANLPRSMPMNRDRHHCAIRVSCRCGSARRGRFQNWRPAGEEMHPHPAVQRLAGADWHAGETLPAHPFMLDHRTVRETEPSGLGSADCLAHEASAVDPLEIDAWCGAGEWRLCAQPVGHAWCRVMQAARNSSAAVMWSSIVVAPAVAAAMPVGGLSDARAAHGIERRADIGEPASGCVIRGLALVAWQRVEGRRPADPRYWPWRGRY